MYGGTIDLFHDFEAYGITTKFVDINDHELVKAAINEKTKLVFAETIGNQNLMLPILKHLQLLHMKQVFHSLLTIQLHLLILHSR